MWCVGAVCWCLYSFGFPVYFVYLHVYLCVCMPLSCLLVSNTHLPLKTRLCFALTWYVGQGTACASTDNSPLVFFQSCYQWGEYSVWCLTFTWCTYVLRTSGDKNKGFLSPFLLMEQLINNITIELLYMCKSKKVNFEKILKCCSASENCNLEYVYL